MVRAKRNGTEGTVSALVIDATKIVCSYCGGTSFMLSSTMDDPNDVAGDTEFAALLLTATSGVFTGLVALCSTCGHEQVPFWQILDVAASDGTALTMTNLDQATTADLMVGLYMYPLAGTDIGKYFTIATNTAAAPTVITPSVAPNADCDGYWVITNIAPTGYTVAS